MQYTLTICLIVLMGLVHGQNQNSKVQFNGVGRTIINDHYLKGNIIDKDTVNAVHGNNGHALLDLAINVNANTTTQVNAVMRLKNEFGGFFGPGAYVQLRQLYAKGIIAQVVKYQVGDIDLKQTKYTLFNSYEEGNVNESELFSIPRKIAYYENFNTDNLWRQQGIQTDYAFRIGNAVEKFTVDGFITRQRGSNFSNVPDKLYGGGRIEVKQSKYITLAGNYVNLFDVPTTVGTMQSFQNPVITTSVNLELDKEIMKYTVFGEMGWSQAIYKNIPLAPADRNGSFFEVGASADHKASDLSFKLSFRKVDHNFISAGAQTKRINYDYHPALFTHAKNAKISTAETVKDTAGYRHVSLFDISRDHTLYNRVITETLMRYDPRLSNSLPYGAATPNRQGLTLDVNYKNKNEKMDAFLSASFLSDIKGQGVSTQRNFVLLRTGANLYLNKIFTWDKNVKINGGIQFDNTTRSGTEFERIHLTSQLIDAGIEIETIRKLDVLFGGKFLIANGNEYIAIRDQYNVTKVNDYIKYNVNNSERMLGAGLKYRFTPKIFITGQAQFINLKDQLETNTSYNINQFFILYNMTF